MYLCGARWSLTFLNADLSGGSNCKEEYMSSVHGNIWTFVDNVTTSMTITIRPNQNRWLTAKGVLHAEMLHSGTEMQQYSKQEEGIAKSDPSGICGLCALYSKSL